MRKTMTTPITRRNRNSFGTVAPIELPTPLEFELLADRYAVRAAFTLHVVFVAFYLHLCRVD